MATQRTTRAGLQYWQLGDANWHLPFAADASLLDSCSAVGALAVIPSAVDSAMAPTGLNVNIAPGVFRSSTGANVSYAGATGQAMPNNATTFLWLTDAGVLTTGSAYPSGVNVVRLASVVAASGVVTTITPGHVMHESAGVGPSGNYLALAGGTMAEAGDITLGTTTGSKLGTLSTQKLGFWGATPVVRPASASQAAVGSFTAATLTDSTGGTASTTLASISDTATKNAVASLAAQHAAVLADLATLKTLVNQLRADLVTEGLIKGSA